MKDLIETLSEEFQDEDYRYAYDEEFSNARMATQIKVARGEMTQAELAEKTGMKQSRISELENVNYSMWTISTLRRIARALGVRVSFKFESWGELLPEIEKFGPETLQVLKFEEDPAFQNASAAAQKPESSVIGTDQLDFLLGHRESNFGRSGDYFGRRSGLAEQNTVRSKRSKDESELQKEAS